MAKRKEGWGEVRGEGEEHTHTQSLSYEKQPPPGITSGGVAETPLRSGCHLFNELSWRLWILDLFSSDLRYSSK